MFPINNDLVFDDWIDTLDSKRLILILDLANKKNYLEDIFEILQFLKSKLKNSDDIRQYYDNIDNKNKNNKRAINSRDPISNNKSSNKYYQSPFNCGSSQCEFRFNGCNHSP